MLEFRITIDTPIALLQTDEFNAWLDGITDNDTRARIDYHVNKIRRGLFGEWKEVDGIYEVKLDFGPGYRVYFGKRGVVIVVLVGGGDKSTQKKDMAAARKWWKEHGDEINEI